MPKPIRPFAAGCLSLIYLAAGCASWNVLGNIQRGRTALLIGDPKAALAYFQKAAELEPDYILNFSLLPQGVWTYVGRAHYAQGQFSEAHKVFEKARSRYQQDNLAKLYFGLVLVREGGPQKGIGEIETGLTGLRDWLNYLDFHHPKGRFWDPGKQIRSEIEECLAMISAKEIDWPKVIAGGQSIGNKLEEEVDAARRDEIEQLYLDKAGRK